VVQEVVLLRNIALERPTGIFDRLTQKHKDDESGSWWT
jgi:hypothetical protein